MTLRALLVSILLGAGVANAQDATYALRGYDTARGEFSGRLALWAHPSGRVRVERDVRYAQGTREVMRGVGQREGRRVHAELRGAPGLTGRLRGATANVVDITLHLAPSGDACASECRVDGVATSRGQGVRSGARAEALPESLGDDEDDDGGAEGWAPRRRSPWSALTNRPLGVEGWAERRPSVSPLKIKKRRRPGAHRAAAFVVDWSDTEALPPLQGAGGEGFTVFRGIPFVAGEGDGDAEIHYNDVEQEGLATCYLAAALIAVAKSDPELIRKMIRDNHDGTYNVYLHNVVDGTKDANIKIDNRFPYETKDEEKLPAFFPLADQKELAGEVLWELWPQIVEKAWARFKGGYEEIEWNRAARVFDFVSGIESKTHHTKSMTPAEIEAAIRAALAAGHPVVLGSKRGGGDAAADLNLVGLHSYIVMQEKDGGFVLFNPWHSSHPPRPVTGEDIKAGFTRLYEGRF